MSSRRTPILIQCIVEGQGERTAVPTLVNRWLERRRFGVERFQIGEAIVTNSVDNLTMPHDSARRRGIEHYVRVAAGRVRGRGAVLVILDAEDACLTREAHGDPPLGPVLLERARSAAEDVPVSVVVASRNFESWILADLTNLRARGHLPTTARAPDGCFRNPDTSKLGPSFFREHLGSYVKTLDQDRLTKLLSLGRGMLRRSRSFQKLSKELEALARLAIAHHRVGRRRE